MRARGVAVAAMAIVCLWSATAVAPPPEFEEVVDLGTNTQRVFGPIDGDRLLDAAYLDADPEADGRAILYRLQTAASTFGPQQRAGPVDDSVDRRSVVAVADPAGDRRSEIVVGLVGGLSEVLLFRQDAGGFEGPETVSVPGLAPDENRRLTGGGAGDVTGDNRPDAVFAVSQPGDDRLVVVTAGPRGTPTIRLSPALPANATSAMFAGVTLFDASGDGVLDIVSAGAHGIGYVTATRGISGWNAFPPLPVTAGDIWDLAIGRFNADAVPDFVVVERTFPPRGSFSLLLSGPGGAYTRSRLTIVPDGIPSAAGAGDLNADGLQDLVLRGDSTITLLGDGQGGFGQRTDIPRSEFEGGEAASIIDLNGDGYGDVVLTGGSDSNTVVYMNRGIFGGPGGCAGCGGQDQRAGPPPPPVRSSSRGPGLGVVLRARKWNPRRRLTFTVGCDERCVATVTPTITFRRRSSPRTVSAIVLKKRVLRLNANRSAAVTIELRGSSVRMVQRLLARGLVGKLTVRIRAVNGARKVTPFRRVIPLRGSGR